MGIKEFVGWQSEMKVESIPAISIPSDLAEDIITDRIIYNKARIQMLQNALDAEDLPLPRIAPPNFLQNARTMISILRSMAGFSLLTGLLNTVPDQLRLLSGQHFLENDPLQNVMIVSLATIAMHIHDKVDFLRGLQFLEYWKYQNRLAEREIYVAKEVISQLQKMRAANDN